MSSGGDEGPAGARVRRPTSGLPGEASRPHSAGSDRGPWQDSDPSADAMAPGRLGSQWAIGRSRCARFRPRDVQAGGGRARRGLVERPARLARAWHMGALGWCDSRGPLTSTAARTAWVRAVDMWQSPDPRRSRRHDVRLQHSAVVLFFFFSRASAKRLARQRGSELQPLTPPGLSCRPSQHRSGQLAGGERLTGCDALLHRPALCRRSSGPAKADSPLENFLAPASAAPPHPPITAHRLGRQGRQVLGSTRVR